MAIDTRQKRQNAAQVGCPMPVSVLPSGASSAAVRYQIGWSYGGFLIPPPSSTTYNQATQIGYEIPWGSDTSSIGYP